jgi:hypothetical protein
MPVDFSLDFEEYLSRARAKALFLVPNFEESINDHKGS